ncbi:hypothetical protein TNCV_910421 [Trichonephila clavipes]|uniref:Uncharacterized protein n=1 Tax=Trichonephila clavipes TaxID=2585209 RepID=A0A8X6W498_TRICX|nr:hypothetical protein TNCV_910421 [Trichonephila clavipes]
MVQAPYSAKRGVLATELGRSSLVIKAGDLGWHAKSSSPIPLNTSRAGERYTRNLSKAQTSSHWCIILGNVVPPKVSSSSLDHG